MYIETAETQRDEVQAKYDKLYNEREAELQVIRDKYEEEMSGYKSDIDTLKSEINNAQNQKRSAVVEEDWQEAAGRGVVNEFYINTLLKKCKVSTMGINNITQKKPLPNDIDVWMVQNEYDDYKLYLAFYEGVMIGVSYRRIPAHAGDPTVPFSFIGQFEEPLQTKKTYQRTGEDYLVNSTYTEWTKQLKSLDLKDADLEEDYILIDEDTMVTIKEGVSEDWDEYGWPRKQKKLAEAK
jgi:hypothetical protein